jgi:hypothetical protein
LVGQISPLDDHSDSMWLPTCRPADLVDEGRDDLVEIAYDGIVGVGHDRGNARIQSRFSPVSCRDAVA